MAGRFVVVRGIQVEGSSLDEMLGCCAHENYQEVRKGVLLLHARNWSLEWGGCIDTGDSAVEYPSTPSNAKKEEGNIFD